jgi:hypothetical protein
MGTSRLFVNLLRPGVDGLSLAFSSSLVSRKLLGVSCWLTVKQLRLDLAEKARGKVV